MPEGAVQRVQDLRRGDGLLMTGRFAFCQMDTDRGTKDGNTIDSEIAPGDYCFPGTYREIKLRDADVHPCRRVRGVLAMQPGVPDLDDPFPEREARFAGFENEAAFLGPRYD